MRYAIKFVPPRRLGKRKGAAASTLPTCPVALTLQATGTTLFSFALFRNRKYHFALIGELAPCARCLAEQAVPFRVENNDSRPLQPMVAGIRKLAQGVPTGDIVHPGDEH